MLAMILAAVLLLLPCVVGAAEPLPAEGLPGTGEVPEPVAFETRTLELIEVPGLVTGDLDHTVRWYETATGCLVAELTGHVSGVSSVRFSPDGKRLITGGEYGDVIVWSTIDHKPLTKLPGYQGRGDFSVPMSSDGRKIAAARREGPVRLWDLESGELLRELVGNVEEFEAMAFSSDGATFASVGWDGTVTIWNVNNGEVLRQWSKPDDVRIFCLAFAPDGKRVATGTESGLVRI